MQTTATGDKPEHRQGGIQVIARAAAIMRELARHPAGQSLGEIAREVHLPRSTVQRIIAALEDEGWVEPTPGTGHRLGPELGRLLYHTSTDVISVVRPLLQELCDDLQETVVFCGLQKHEVLVIDRIVAERELRVVPPMGIIHVPFHATAPGKALLATMADDQIDAILTEPLPARTPKSRNKAQLLREIADIRHTGIAEESEEYLEGLASFAVSMDTYLGRFAVALIVPVSRAVTRREQYLEPLRAFRARVESRIGR